VSDSDNGHEVYMVGQGEPSAKKIIKEIARETKEALARAPWLEEEEADKRHNGWQGDSRSSRMVLALRDTIESTISNVRPTKIGSETGHSQSVRKLVGSCTREIRSIARR
jgi:hypothetical protein